MSGFSVTVSSNPSTLNLVKPHCLELWSFWQPGNLNLALYRTSISHSLSFSLVQMDTMTWPVWALGHCALGLPKGTWHTFLEPVSLSTRQHLDVDDVEGVEPHSDVKTIFATAFHHVLAGTNMGSLRSFKDCTYPSDTIWPHGGNSSTFAFFCPTSKMQILASGAPLQKGDFGYDLFFQYY